MSKEAFDAGQHLDHMAAVLGLTIDPAWREGVVGHVAAVARMAGLVTEFQLDDHTDPAFVFEADR